MDDIAERGNKEESQDYKDNDGFLICGNCHTRKQKDIKVSTDFKASGVWRVPVPCKCKAEEIKAEEEQQNQLKIKVKLKKLQKEGIKDLEYLNFTFDKDDKRNLKISDACKKYVDHWAEMESNNIGIIFYGDVGTGKSFMACCIANALINKLIKVSVTNFPNLLNKLQGSFGEQRQNIIDSIKEYSLLVIDDLGTERDTSYSAEQVFNVIDTRYKSGKPLIITTNLSINDLKNPPDISNKRIYDRILEMCPIQIKIIGESRRSEKADIRKEKAKEILGF